MFIIFKINFSLLKSFFILHQINFCLKQEFFIIILSNSFRLESASKNFLIIVFILLLFNCIELRLSPFIVKLIFFLLQLFLFILIIIFYFLPIFFLNPFIPLITFLFQILSLLNQTYHFLVLILDQQDLISLLIVKIFLLLIFLLILLLSVLIKFFLFEVSLFLLIIIFFLQKF